MQVVWAKCMHSRHVPGTDYCDPCGREKDMVMGPTIDTDTPCPLPGCRGPELGIWRCCRCGHDKNRRGWCMGDVRVNGQPRREWDPSLNGGNGDWRLVNVCDHGNCDRCTTICKLTPDGEDTARF